MKKLSIHFILLLFFFMGCLGDTSPEEPTFATGNIEAEFIDAESGEPLVNQEFNLLLAPEDSEQNIPIGVFVSNEDGIIETEIAGQEEMTVVRAIFEYLDENEELQTIEEDISLELRYEEPFDTVSLSFEI